MPAQAGIQLLKGGIPACAGVTGFSSHKAPKFFQRDRGGIATKRVTGERLAMPPLTRPRSRAFLLPRIG